MQDKKPSSTKEIIVTCCDLASGALSRSGEEALAGWSVMNGTGNASSYTEAFDAWSYVHTYSYIYISNIYIYIYLYI